MTSINKIVSGMVGVLMAVALTAPVRSEELPKEEWLFRSEPEKALIKLHFDKNKGANAELSYDPKGAEESTGCLKVNVISGGEKVHDVQALIVPRILKKDKEYELQMSLKVSPGTATVLVAIIQHASPWKDIGGKMQRNLTEKWQKFTSTVKMTEDGNPDARVDLFIGGPAMSGKTIWIDNIRLLQLPAKEPAEGKKEQKPAGKKTKKDMILMSSPIAFVGAGFKPAPSDEWAGLAPAPSDVGAGLTPAPSDVGAGLKPAPTKPHFLILLCFQLLLATTVAALDRRLPRPLPGHPGNVFLTDEIVTLSVPDQFTGLAWRLTDYDEKKSAGGKVDGPTVTLGKVPVGYYKFSIHNKLGVEVYKTSLGLLAPLKVPTPEDSPVCIDGAVGEFYFSRKGKPDLFKESSNLMALIGINWVRDRLVWAHIETEPGKLNVPSRYDEALKAQQAEGLKILELSRRAPPWDYRVQPPLESFPPIRRLPDDFIPAYRFLKAIAQRYKNLVLAWETWNEADNLDFGGHLVSEIASYQKAAYFGLKAGDPNALVALNSWTGDLVTPINVQNMDENDILPYSEIYNFHSYLPEGGAAESNVELFREAAGPRSLWLTERGLNTAFWSGPNREISLDDEKKKAEFIPKSYAMCTHYGVHFQFFFLLPHYAEKRVQYGLLNPDLTARSCFVAMGATGRLMAGAKAFGKLKGAPGLTGYILRAMPDGHDRLVLVLWKNSKSEKPVSWTVPFAKHKFELYDLLGREQKLKGNQLQIGDSPLYFVFPLAAAATLEYELPKPASLKKIGEPCPVVLDLKPPVPLAYMDLKKSCYYVRRENPVQLEVRAYNFSDLPFQGQIQVEPSFGWVIEPSTREIALAPLEKKLLNFTLKAGDELKSKSIEPGPIRFLGNFKNSVSVLVPRFGLIEESQTLKPISSYSTLSNWEDNVSEDSSMTKWVDSEGWVHFDFEFGKEEQWAYPVLNLEPDDLPGKETEGLVFDLKVLEGKGWFRAFLDESDGTRYISDAKYGPTELDKPGECFIHLKDSTLVSSSDENNRLDPEEINRVLLGGNLSGKKVRLAVKNLRWVKFSR